MFAKLFGSGAKPSVVHEVPPGSRVYAVGDIHGRADLVAQLHDMIRDDACIDPVERNVVVYLGDYVDRGHDSRKVIDLILDHPLKNFETVHLVGNHEDIMLVFLEDASVGSSWFLNGGDATLFSYGVGQPQISDRGERLELLQQRLAERLPDRHLAFLRSLKLYHIEGDYLFVHAGIRPGRDIEKQDREDLLWIREEFLRSDSDHGKCVVHGHTISTQVEMRDNRIGIDTGAYFTGKLTCLVLEGDEQRFLQTRS